MIVANFASPNVQITLTPNRSASWKQVKVLMLFFTLFCLSIAFLWALMGAWMILPFAGLEISLLIGIMYLVSANSYRREVIIFNKDEILIASGKNKLTQTWSFNRQHCQLLVFQTNHPEDSPVFHLVDEQQRIELGIFLSKEDKETLKEYFDKMYITTKLVKKSISLAF